MCCLANQLLMPRSDRPFASDAVSKSPVCTSTWIWCIPGRWPPSRVTVLGSASRKSGSVRSWVSDTARMWIGGRSGLTAVVAPETAAAVAAAGAAADGDGTCSEVRAVACGASCAAVCVASVQADSYHCRARFLGRSISRAGALARSRQCTLRGLKIGQPFCTATPPFLNARADARRARARARVSNQGESFGKAGARMSDCTQPGH